MDYYRIRRVILRTLRHFGINDVDNSEDLIQSTWVKALEFCNSTGEKIEDKPDGWWASTARTVFLNYLRDTQRQKRDVRKTESLARYLEEVENAGDEFFDNPLVDYRADPLEILIAEENGKGNHDENEEA